MKRILLPNHHGKIIVNPVNIIYCKADGKYSKICIKDFGEYMISKCLSELEKVLTDESFCRIHRKYLVNLHYLEQIHTNGKCVVIMKGDTNFPVAIRRRSRVIGKIKEYFKE